MRSHALNAGLRPRLLRAARRLPPPASGSPRTPLPARRVPRPAPLPVVAGPYIRCPPALSSAVAAAAAMLSRSRCVSRAFSRSLSAFQKVRFGRALVGGGEKPAGGQTGSLGTGARRARQAGHQGHRDAEAAGWVAHGRCCPGVSLAEPGGPSASRGSRRPVHCCTPPSAPRLRSRPQPCPPRRETQSLGGGVAESPDGIRGPVPSLLFKSVGISPVGK